MSSSDLPLFDGAGEPASCQSLIVRLGTGGRQSRKQQTVNRLLAKVERLRGQLAREKRRLEEALVFHAAQVTPRLQRVTALRKDLVRALVPFLKESRLKRADRKALGDILANQIDEIVAHDGAPDEDIKDLFERLYGVGFEEVVQGQLDEAHATMAAMFDALGLDIEVPELRPDMSEEELAASAATFAERLQQQETARAEPSPTRRKTKRQVRADERASRFERMRKVSIGATYRRLAKALHPDLEPEAAARARKSEVMREVTTAYARNDLHTLLRLEMEWLEGEARAADGSADETLDAYAQVLKQQVAELEAEYMELPYHPRYQTLLAEGPLGMPLPVDGPSEAARIDRLIESLNRTLERMGGTQVLQEVRTLITVHRQTHRRQPRYR